jgi:hypothetical protein
MLEITITVANMIYKNGHNRKIAFLNGYVNNYIYKYIIYIKVVKLKSHLLKNHRLNRLLLTFGRIESYSCSLKIPYVSFQAVAS